MQAEERQRQESSTDRTRESDLGINIAGGLAAKIDWNKYPAVCAQPRRPGESALDFAFRCMEESLR